MENKELKSRIIDISYQHKLSHLGSCLTAVDIIEEIYQQKKIDEPFILSSGHAGLALYTVIEKHIGIDAEQIYLHHGVHPDRCSRCHLDCSTGSLGQGLPIAVGMALANRERDVWCLISDGECAEGSIWEALAVAEKEKLLNLKVYVNINGLSAYDNINIGRLARRLKDFQVPIMAYQTNVAQLPFLKGLDAHYLTMNEEQYRQAKEVLS